MLEYRLVDMVALSHVISNVTLLKRTDQKPSGYKEEKMAMVGTQLRRQRMHSTGTGKAGGDVVGLE